MLGAALIATLLSKKVVFIYIPHSDAGGGLSHAEDFFQQNGIHKSFGLHMYFHKLAHHKYKKIGVSAKSF